MTNGNKDAEHATEEQTTLEIDAYGIKYRHLKKFEAEDNEPATWSEVWERVQAQLRRICANLPGVVGDGIGAARSILQGVGGFAKSSAALPDAIARRIRRGHAIVESAEDQQQQLWLEAEPMARQDHPPAIAAEALKEKLEELRQRGHCVELIEHEDGSFTIILKHYEGPEDSPALPDEVT